MDMASLSKQFYYKNNRLQQIRGFFYTAQLGSVSKAAKHMHLNQSTVTMQIQALERDFKTSLFNRDKQRVKLTVDGEILYTFVLPLIEGMDNLYRRFVTAKKKNELSKLRIAANHITILYMLPDILKRYMDDHPQVKVHLNSTIIDDGLKQLIANKIDVIVGPLSEAALTEEFTFYPVKTYDPVLLVKQGHPLAKLKKVTPREIGKYPFIRIAPHLITLPTFEQIAKEYKFQSNLSFEAGDWVILKRFVRAGIANAMVSSICLEKGDKDIVGIPLNDYFPSMAYGVIVKKAQYLLPQVADFIRIFLPDWEESPLSAGQEHV